MAEVLSAFASIATFLSVLFGIFVFHSDRRRTAKTETLIAYKEMQDDVFSELNSWAPAEVRKAMEDYTSDAYKKLSELLAKTELFCAGLKNGIYDFKTFNSVAHGYFDGEKGKLYRRLVIIIDAKSQDAEEDYFENIHWVWNKMERCNK